MLLRNLSISLTLGSLFSLSIVSAAITPEETCFQNLNQQIATSSVFSNINLEQLTKKNGADDDLVSSKPFSSKTYTNFLNLAEIPVPRTKSFIGKFPDEVSDVDNIYLEPIPKYKANRTNVAFLLGDSNEQTSIGDYNKDGVTDVINGYYVDSKILTFGRKSDLIFPFPSRKAAPAKNKMYPFGRPYADMREYIIFSQHLSPRFGGKFIGCGVAKLTAEGEYSLASWNGEKSISPFYYGGQVMQGSDMSTRVLPVKNGYKFRATDVRIQTNAKTEIQDKIFYKDPLMRYETLVLAYDNGSNFYNEFITHQIFTEVMSRPENQSKNVDEVIEQVIEAMNNRTNLGVLGGLGTVGFNNFRLVASLITDVTAASDTESNNDDFKWGGVAVSEGINYKTMKKINSIKDENLKIMLKTAITPGYYENFETIPTEEQNAFEKAYLKMPLTFEEKLENVEYILDNAEDIELLNPQNLEFKDIAFGGSVIPVEDKRIKEIRSKSYLKDEEKRLLKEKNIQLESLKITPEMDILERQKILDRKSQIETDYRSKISKLYNFEDEFIKFKVDYFDLKNQKKVGRISADEFEQKIKNLYQKFEIKSNRGFLKDVLTEESKKKISDDLLERKPLITVKKKIQNNSKWFGKYFYYTMGIIFFGIAILLALFGLKVMRKSKQIM